MVVPPPLAFKASFEGVPVIWVKQFVVSEVLRYTGRLRKLYIGSWGFKRHFSGPLHFLHPLSGGCCTRLRIWDEQLVYQHPHLAWWPILDQICSTLAYSTPIEFTLISVTTYCITGNRIWIDKDWLSFYSVQTSSFIVNCTMQYLSNIGAFNTLLIAPVLPTLVLEATLLVAPLQVAPVLVAL